MDCCFSALPVADDEQYVVWWPLCWRCVGHISPQWCGRSSLWAPEERKGKIGMRCWEREAKGVEVETVEEKVKVKVKVSK